MQKKVVIAFKILWYCDEKGDEGFTAFASLFFYLFHWNGHRLSVLTLKHFKSPYTRSEHAGGF